MVIAYDDLPRLRTLYRNHRIVLGGGVFDLVHTGHLRYIQGMRRYGEIVVVMVKSDKRVRRHKDASRPIISEQDRVRMVAALGGVDFAFIAPDVPANPAKLDTMHEAVLAALRPDAFYSTNPNWKKLERLGMTKVIIGHRPPDGVSTTAIVEYIVSQKSPAKI